MWFAKCLIPQLSPGDIILIDNASFLDSEAIEQMVAEAGCEVWYLCGICPNIPQTSRRLSIAGFHSKIGCGNGDMNLIAAAYPLCP
jgi:hypothetical protein